ncbi:uncharacterized protein LOC136067902 [Quercus suber]|uniref:uncharacterized protein LOC136067902 n=1 Tax=Quercus suber TaxID=58331 RepID=UPI0032DFAC4A
MGKPEAAGRMVQWAIELSQFNVEYHPRTAIKAQALADFIAEFTLPNKDDLTDKEKRWTIQTDERLLHALLEVVDEEEAKYILEETHEGVCGDHVGPKSLVRKIIRTGYFWPTMQTDATEFINKCQQFGNVQRLPAEKLTTIASS